jgi:hypothetical protein
MGKISRIEQIRDMVRDQVLEIHSNKWGDEIVWILEELMYDHKISKAEMREAITRLAWDVVVLFP